MIQIEEKYREILLEALEELMYKVSLDLESLKGGPLTRERKVLTKKQKQLDALQHLISPRTENQQQEELVFVESDYCDPGLLTSFHAITAALARMRGACM